MFSTAEAAHCYILAGNARVTLVSPKTGARFTYRVRRPRNGKDVRYVGVLTGPDNEADYAFLGTILADGRFSPSRDGAVSGDAPSARAFAWAWERLRAGRLPCEVHHTGRCGRCGRTLTVPESVATGLGPECAQKAST